MAPIDDHARNAAGAPERRTRRRGVPLGRCPRHVPGITTGYDDLTFAGHHSAAMLLGVFSVSVMHNIVHLVFGIAGLIMARTAEGARAYLIGGGVIYLVLWVYGLVIDQASAANFVPVNTADNWLLFALGAS
jgi:hypothetical protein